MCIDDDVVMHTYGYVYLCVERSIHIIQHLCEDIGAGTTLLRSILSAFADRRIKYICCWICWRLMVFVEFYKFVNVSNKLLLKSVCLYLNGCAFKE